MTQTYKQISENTLRWRHVNPDNGNEEILRNPYIFQVKGQQSCNVILVFIWVVTKISESMANFEEVVLKMFKNYMEGAKTDWRAIPFMVSSISI